VAGRWLRPVSPPVLRRPMVGLLLRACPLTVLRLRMAVSPRRTFQGQPAAHSLRRWGRGHRVLRLLTEVLPVVSALRAQRLGPRLLLSGILPTRFLLPLVAVEPLVVTAASTREGCTTATLATRFLPLLAVVVGIPAPGASTLAGTSHLPVMPKTRCRRPLVVALVERTALLAGDVGRTSPTEPRTSPTLAAAADVVVEVVEVEVDRTQRRVRLTATPTLTVPLTGLLSR
jgi:hypothetical protein